ncbi:winged helix-turn-helix domain-containing protein [Rhodanobacter sp. C03]|uniref:winged helix-turn-helix domain-containing protein n=1 Tax=Rhodanobacter sp. C03 TaxID=1945858 RepID=UPI00143A6FDF|nr:winged helix-turn-helix domain-containing protein [Rhodanobacter sp. C03]
MSVPGSRWIYQCDDIVVEPRAHRLERNGHPILVEPKAYAVLVALIEQAGAMIGKNALLDTVWGHRNVTPGVLTRVISQLRNALGDPPHNPRYIATVNCLGYRFIGEVHRCEASPAAPTIPREVTSMRTATDTRLMERRRAAERRNHPRRDAS